MHDLVEVALQDLADTAAGSPAAAGLACAPVPVSGRAIVDTVESWILVEVHEKCAAIVHNPTKYSRELYHVACRAPEQKHTHHIASAEEDKYLVEVHSYYNSSLLPPGCLLVLMELMDTLTIGAEHEVFDLLYYAGYKYLRDDLPTFCHNSGQQ